VSIRKRRTQEVVLQFATSNEHKFEEAKSIFEEFDAKVSRVNLKTREIQNDSLEEIATDALAQALQKTSGPVFVEDAGLFVEGLNGFPGPYSSYVFKTLGVAGITKLLDGAKIRKASFKSAIALGMKKDLLQMFTAETEGTILQTPRGKEGFGFDPIFQPVWTNKTFGEMTIREKNVYSHRAKCIKKMILWYQNWISNQNVTQQET
jgi:XTP/dITP diphosphohydrolase